jgi:hypothetical protein
MYSFAIGLVVRTHTQIYTPRLKNKFKTPSMSLHAEAMLRLLISLPAFPSFQIISSTIVAPRFALLPFSATFSSNIAMHPFSAKFIDSITFVVAYSPPWCTRFMHKDRSYILTTGFSLGLRFDSITFSLLIHVIRYIR